MSNPTIKASKDLSGRNTKVAKNRIHNKSLKLREQFRKPEYSTPDELILAIDEYIRRQSEWDPQDPTSYMHPFYDIQDRFEVYWQRLHDLFTGFVSSSFYNFILVDCADYFVITKALPPPSLPSSNHISKEVVLNKEQAIEEDVDDIRVNVLFETTLRSAENYQIKSWYKCSLCETKFTSILEEDQAEQPHECPTCSITADDAKRSKKHLFFPYKQRYVLDPDVPYTGRTLHDMRRCVHCRTFNTLCLPSIYNALGQEELS